MSDMVTAPGSCRPLEGRVVIVTGAASGIGEAAARLFHEAGAHVALVDRSAASLERVQSSLTDGRGASIAVATDVSVEREVQAMVSTVVDRLGRIDGAFNNAGIAGPEVSLSEHSLDEWQRTIDVNLTGVFLCMRHEIQAMLRTGGGAIVNTASAGGQVGIAHNAAYVASKHGVLGLTKTAAIEYASQGIRVNAVCPGLTATPMTAAADFGAEPEAAVAAVQPIGRLGRPEEVAAAAMYLLGDGASFVHGAALAVDGGYLAL